MLYKNSFENFFKIFTKKKKENYLFNPKFDTKFSFKKINTNFEYYFSKNSQQIISKYENIN